jgi:hypothetical protein
MQAVSRRFWPLSTKFKRLPAVVEGQMDFGSFGKCLMEASAGGRK